ncbi:flagellar biosynthesis protein FliQ [Trichloromonas acetexigens]|jgi:flagellar biosynthetic protein FliQ|uniref:Flagellar biosynthetic protein FliQ n=1 Tax=Trichloromonas acetexigens TaxID=38815 RepID=A0A550JIQ1_9BACT|nr:flagellar biosynthesis protein FliQ [Desulfuromonas acetexigens]TRO83089.1 flagellar biosynthesis protein FliQ [Desulfuromonas acetexigens]
MTPEFVVALGRQSVELVLMLAAPMLICALVVGLLISIFQAATQINEQTMTFIPKIVAVLVSLIIFAPWMIQKLLSFTSGILVGIATTGI